MAIATLCVLCGVSSGKPTIPMFSECLQSLPQVRYDNVQTGLDHPIAWLDLHPRSNLMVDTSISIVATNRPERLLLVEGGVVKLILSCPTL